MCVCVCLLYTVLFTYPGSANQIQRMNRKLTHYLYHKSIEHGYVPTKGEIHEIRDVHVLVDHRLCSLEERALKVIP